MARLGYYPYVMEDPDSGAKKYSVRLKAYHTIGKEECKRFGADAANISEGELGRGFAALSQAIIDLVLNGHSITLDGLGCFSFSTKTGLWDEKAQKYVSAGKSSMDDVNAGDIKSIHIRYRPCTYIRHQLKSAEFFNVVNKKFGASSGLDGKDGVTDGYGTSAQGSAGESGDGAENP